MVAPMFVLLVFGGCTAHRAKLLGELFQTCTSLLHERKALQVRRVLRVKQRKAGLQLTTVLDQ